MQSKEFLCDLGLMYDALSEHANLFQQLQAHSITLLRAEQLLKRTFRVLASFKDSPGEKSEEALKAHASGHFGSVSLESNAKLTPVNAKQFLQSLITNMEKRLSFGGETLCDLSILDTRYWPSTPGIRHGESRVKWLCRRFNLCENQAVNGMRDFLEHADHPLQPGWVWKGFQSYDQYMHGQESYNFVVQWKQFYDEPHQWAPCKTFPAKEVHHNMAEKPSLCHASKETKHTSDAWVQALQSLQTTRLVILVA